MLSELKEAGLFNTVRKKKINISNKVEIYS